MKFLSHKWPFLLLLLSVIACQKTDPTYGPETQNLTLADIRGLLTGDGDASIPNGYKVNGVVISAPENEDGNLVYVEDESNSSALKVRFDVSHTYRVGDKLEMYISGLKLSRKDGEYELGSLPLIFANRTGGSTIQPRQATAADATAHFNEWSSSLLNLKAMKMLRQLDAETYELGDSLGEGTIQAYVSSGLSYVMPDSLQSITGYLARAGSGIQLRARNAADLLAYNPGISGPDTIRESFDAGGEGSYASGDKVFTGFSSGDWMFNDASVLGTVEVNDLRNGEGSVRLRGKTAGGGYIYTLFDVKGLKKIRFLFGGTKLGEGGDEVLEYSQETFISKDAGASWTSLGKKIGKRGEFTRMEYEVNSEPSDNVRVKIANTSYLRSTGNRIRANVDDVELIH